MSKIWPITTCGVIWYCESEETKLVATISSGHYCSGAAGINSTAGINTQGRCCGRLSNSNCLRWKSQFKVNGSSGSILGGQQIYVQSDQREWIIILLESLLKPTQCNGIKENNYIAEHGIQNTQLTHDCCSIPIVFTDLAMSQQFPFPAEHDMVCVWCFL